MIQAAASSAFDDLLETSLRLTDLIAAEIAALRAMRPRDIAPLQEEKAQLAVRYGEALTRLRADPEVAKQADPSRRGQLREAIQRLRELVGDNVRALGAARGLNEKLMRVIADAVAAQRKPAPGYTATGTQPRGNSALDPSAASISVDETA